MELLGEDFLNRLVGHPPLHQDGLHEPHAHENDGGRSAREDDLRGAAEAGEVFGTTLANKEIEGDEKEAEKGGLCERILEDGERTDGDGLRDERIVNARERHGYRHGNRTADTASERIKRNNNEDPAEDKPIDRQTGNKTGDGSHEAILPRFIEYVPLALCKSSGVFHFEMVTLRITGRMLCFQQER